MIGDEYGGWRGSESNTAKCEVWNGDPMQPNTTH